MYKRVAVVNGVDKLGFVWIIYLYANKFSSETYFL